MIAFTNENSGREFASALRIHALSLFPSLFFLRYIQLNCYLQKFFKNSVVCVCVHVCLNLQLIH